MSVLVVAMEKVERSSGSLIGSSIASLQKSTAPEVIFGMQNMLVKKRVGSYCKIDNIPVWIQMLLALMDEAYTGSMIGDEGADFESEESNTMGAADPLFLELLKDENDGLAVWSFHVLASILHIWSMHCIYRLEMIDTE